jgi:hypothetical protein
MDSKRRTKNNRCAVAIKITVSADKLRFGCLAPVNYDTLNLIRVGMLSICDRSIFGFLANYQGKFARKFYYQGKLT